MCAARCDATQRKASPWAIFSPARVGAWEGRIFPGGLLGERRRKKGTFCFCFFYEVRTHGPRRTHKAQGWLPAIDRARRRPASCGAGLVGEKTSMPSGVPATTRGAAEDRVGIPPLWSHPSGSRLAGLPSCAIRARSTEGREGGGAGSRQHPKDRGRETIRFGCEVGQSTCACPALSGRALLPVPGGGGEWRPSHQSSSWRDCPLSLSLSLSLCWVLVVGD